MSKESLNSKAHFGTLPVFMTAISTILGAILFLRFGYAVGHTGFLGALLIIFIGHLVTLPTALAVAEIATNQRVQGGGAYYIISRSFGLNIGATIGITLYLSQAISVSFYVIAFAEAFEPFAIHITDSFPLMNGFAKKLLLNKKIIGLTSMIALTVLMLTKGANIGVKALNYVVGILFLSLVLFFIGKPIDGYNFSEVNFINKIENSDSFFYVFTIIFPAFTGIAAGLGLSGDLKDPKTSIPKGTIIATIVGIVIYILVALKLVISAPLNDLSSDQLIMSRIALWGPIIPIGLGCAAISSALGSIMVAPRTLQALGNDNIFPSDKLNTWTSKGKSIDNEPINASIITCLIAFSFVYVGDINFVAQVISMFFMVTYGAICTISFLEHFSSDPSYRPTFKSRWYISLIGAITSFWLMFKMNAPYALISLGIMFIIYYYISKFNKSSKGLVKLFRGAIFQLNREIQVYVQKKEHNSEDDADWRPFCVCVSEDSFKRRDAFDFMRWISQRYGFGTYIHFIKGYLSRKTHLESKEVLSKLIKLTDVTSSRLYVDTIISPSYTSAIAQVIQVSGISGKGNNLMLFEYNDGDKNSLNRILDNYSLLKATDYDACILRSTTNRFGSKKSIHVWISSRDYENSNLMILISYILLGHRNWKGASIKIFSIYSEGEIKERREKIHRLIQNGRLPISPNNIELIAKDENTPIKKVINKYSYKADLTIIGFRNEVIKTQQSKLFSGYDKLGNTLFVNSLNEKEIN